MSVLSICSCVVGCLEKLLLRSLYHLTIFAVDTPNITLFVDVDSLTRDGYIERTYPFELHTILGKFHQIALLLVVAHTIEYIINQHATREATGVQFLDKLFGQNPRLKSAPLLVELNQLRPRHILARLLAATRVVSKEGIPVTLAGGEPDARAYVDAEADALDGLHSAGVEDLHRAGHWHQRVVRVGAIEAMTLDKGAVYVANLILVRLVPGGDGVAREGKFCYVVILDGVEMVLIHSHALSGIVGGVRFTA